MMQDGKALQIGTSHYLGQNFAKAFDVTFTNTSNEQEHVYATSWGVSTRLMGGLIMSHSDDKGLVLPPAIAPVHVMIVPIWKTDEEKQKVSDYIISIQEKLTNKQSRKMGTLFEIEGKSILYETDLVCKVDWDDQKTMGRKMKQYELQGVPIRIAIGPRDVESGSFAIERRDQEGKIEVNADTCVQYIAEHLLDMQQQIASKYQTFITQRIKKADTWDDFIQLLETGHFVLAHWDGTAETEERIKEMCKATIRCIPYDSKKYKWDASPGECILTGKPSAKRVIFAMAY